MLANHKTAFIDLFKKELKINNMKMNFEFSKEEYEILCEKAMLNEEFRELFKMKINDYSTIQIAEKLNHSERTIYRRIKKLKRMLKKVL